MQPRRVRVPTRDLIDEIMAYHLRHRLGAATPYMDYISFIEAIMDGFLYRPTRDMRVDPARLLTDMGLPTDIARAVADSTGERIRQTIQQGFGVIWPSRTYSYTVLPGNDVVVTEDLD